MFGMRSIFIQAMPKIFGSVNGPLLNLIIELPPQSSPLEPLLQQMFS